MKVIDISWTLSERMTAYKNQKEKKARITSTRVFSKHGMRESQIILNTHTGTHVDAPKHFLPRGKSLDKQPLATYVGKCVVVDAKNAPRITASEVRKARISKSDIVLFKTKNSRKKENARFDPDFVFIDSTAARELVKKKIKAAGIDYLSIETKQPGHETHKTLLKHDIGIIEGLRLAHVKAGKYFFVGVPLKIAGSDAAPCRAVLIKK